MATLEERFAQLQAAQADVQSKYDSQSMALREMKAQVDGQSKAGRTQAAGNRPVQTPLLALPPLELPALKLKTCSDLRQRQDNPSDRPISAPDACDQFDMEFNRLGRALDKSGNSAMKHEARTLAPAVSYLHDDLWALGQLAAQVPDGELRESFRVLYTRVHRSYHLLLFRFDLLMTLCEVGRTQPGLVGYIEQLRSPLRGLPISSPEVLAAVQDYHDRSLGARLKMAASQPPPGENGEEERRGQGGRRTGRGRGSNAPAGPSGSRPNTRSQTAPAGPGAGGADA